MKTFKNTCLDKYKLNKKNTFPGSKPTRLDPGNPPEVAIDITEVYIEDKTSVLKSLKVGDEIKFFIKQDLQLFRDGEYYDHYTEGEGAGTVSGIENFEESCSDDEYQEIAVTLEDGYAEGL